MEQVHKHIHLKEMAIQFRWQFKITLKRNWIFHLSIIIFFSILNGFISCKFVMPIWFFRSSDFARKFSWLEIVFTEGLSPFLPYCLCILKKISKYSILILKIFWFLAIVFLRFQSAILNLTKFNHHWTRKKNSRKA